MAQSPRNQLVLWASLAWVFSLEPGSVDSVKEDFGRWHRGPHGPGPFSHRSMSPGPLEAPPCLLLNLYLYLILTPEQIKLLSPRKLGPSCPETLQPGSHCPTVTTGRKLHEVETHQSQLHPDKKRLQDRRSYSKQGLARQTLPHCIVPL